LLLHNCFPYIHSGPTLPPYPLSNMKYILELTSTNQAAT
jgi:hypothetical protein